MASQLDHDQFPPTEVDSAWNDVDRLNAKHEAFKAPKSSEAVPDAGIERESPEAPIINDDILRLIPLNTEARRAFDSVVLLEKAGKLDEIHAQHIQVTGTGPLSCTSDDALTDGEMTTEEAPSDIGGLPIQRTVHNGYFRVRFDLPAVSQRPVWVIGKGSSKKKISSRNVDILLAAPGSKDAYGLRAAHAFLQLHRESGVWMLAAGAKVVVDDVVLRPDELIALYHPTTRLDVLDMQYLIEFVIKTPEMEQKYLKERNRVLQEQGIPLPYTDMSGIPLLPNTALQSIIFRHGLGSGTFGNVFEGLNPNSGDLRVAKRVTLKSRHEVQDLAREIQALVQFEGREGILKLLDWRTALNGQELLVSQYPLDVYLVHDKGIAFHRYDWKDQNWDMKRLLCSQLLKGLVKIHQAGCMHRDITQMNLLFFPNQKPPQAELCDFGKFCDSSQAKDTRLAAWQFLPPELEKGQQHPYGQALDIWMLGLAMANAWWPQTALERPRERLQYNRMQKLLWDETQDGRDLAHLIVHMMAWEPDKRPSAAQALTHGSLKKVAGGTAPVKTSSAKRLHDHSG
ncbi:MAG: hypothetical protein Q9170_002385 [Blastenia crenularia]